MLTVYQSEKNNPYFAFLMEVDDKEHHE